MKYLKNILTEYLICFVIFALMILVVALTGGNITPIAVQIAFGVSLATLIALNLWRKSDRKSRNRS